MNKNRPKGTGMKVKNPASPTVRFIQELSARGIRIQQSVFRLLAKTTLGCLLVTGTVFAQAPNPVLEFNAHFSGTRTKLYWATAPEFQANYFAIERSWNGADFETVGLVGAQPATADFGNYSFIDKDYFTSIVYYRLRVVDAGLKSVLAGNIVGIQLAEDARDFIVKPLLGLPGSLYIDAGKLNGQEIIVDATDSEKQIIANAILSKDGRETSFALRSFQSLRPGLYTVSAFFDHRVLKTRLLVKEAQAPVSQNQDSGGGIQLSRK